MRLACTGFVCEQAGSVGAANTLLLRELLNIGFEIISSRSHLLWIHDQPSEIVKEWRFVPVVNHFPINSARTVEQVSLISVLGQNDATFYNRLLVKAIRREHIADRGYDAVLWVGDYAHGALDGVPIISFAQGAPGTDARSILRRGAEIGPLAGGNPR